LDAISASFKSRSHKQITPLILAYADPILCPVSKWVTKSDSLANMTNRVNNYRDLIAQGVHELIGEIASQRAMLNTVCNITSMFANRNLPRALLTHVCTFLGIPNFSVTPHVVIPQNLLKQHSNGLLKNEPFQRHLLLLKERVLHFCQIIRPHTLI